MIDLNGNEFSSPVMAIFNNGVAGRVDNVNISVEKRKADEPDNNPAYKVIFTDSFGSINIGIYYPNETSTDSNNKALSQRCADMVRAVMGDDFVFPSFENYNQLVDGCMRIIAENCKDAKVNVVATYGRVGLPKKYLGIYKTYNFIEKAGTTPTKLRITNNPNKPEYNDLLERVAEDLPTLNTSESTTTDNSKSSVDWL